MVIRTNHISVNTVEPTLKINNCEFLILAKFSSLLRCDCGYRFEEFFTSINPQSSIFSIDIPHVFEVGAQNAVAILAIGNGGRKNTL